MKIAIEAQRIFRKKKHGMDIVILEALKEIKRQDTSNEYYIFVAPGPDKCLEKNLKFSYNRSKMSVLYIMGANRIALCCI